MQIVYALTIDTCLWIKEDVDDLCSIACLLLCEEQVLIVVTDHAQLDDLLCVQLHRFLLILQLLYICRL